MSSGVKSAPFSRAVFKAIRTLYPEQLADKSWDNTGLLLEAPFNPSKIQKNSVLLTVDLTKAVADEAIRRKDSVIISYHPIIFRGLKSLTFGDSQQASLLRLAAEGISVYCPHTAFDSATGGLNDWLADQIATPVREIPEQTKASSAESTIAHLRPVVRKFEKYISHQRSTITPVDPPVPNHPTAGPGRIVRFKNSQFLTDILQRISLSLGSQHGLPVAIPQGASLTDIVVSSVGICAGSGGGVLNGLKDVDVLFTGELSHHEALAAIERGQCVVSVFHSNSERGFLSGVLKEQLEKEVKTQWGILRNEEKGGLELQNADVEIAVSQADRDPYGIVTIVPENEDES